MSGVWRPRDVSAGSDTKSLLFETGIEQKLDAENSVRTLAESIPPAFL
jgi:hypothetical protein